MTTARPDPRVRRSPSRQPPATNLDPRPRNIEPHSAPGSHFNYISYSFYQRIKEGLRPPTLGHPTTPRAATSASLAVPSPSASLAMQSTHALMALLALTSWPAPASSSANSPPLTPPPLTSHSSQLTPSPGPTTPAGLTPPRSVSLAASHQPLAPAHAPDAPRVTDHEPPTSSPAPQHRRESLRSWLSIARIDLDFQFLMLYSI